MSSQLLDRIRRTSWHKLVMPVQETLKFFKPGQTLGLSGFTPAGYPKAIPIALLEHVAKEKLQGHLKFSVFVGASVGSETLDRWAAQDMIERYYPYQTGPNIAGGINQGKIIFKDIHLSNFANSLTYHHFKRPIDLAIIEASAITADGGIVPGAAGGVAQEVVQQAENILIEVNTSIPNYYGLHDLVPDHSPPHRRPMLISRVDDRIGEPVLRCDPSKVIGIVESRLPDNGRPLDEPGVNEKKIASHILEFFEQEVKFGRLPANLLPLQSGVGSIANAVLGGFAESKFRGLTTWTEVLQDTMLDLLDNGVLTFGSTTSVSLSAKGFKRFYENWDKYAPKIIIRPQAISNHPEVIRRLGVIAMNTPVEFDIYGHANSTHLAGSKIINGIGGSGDFLRNAFLSIIHSPSARKTKTDPTGISCIVPFCSHIDHTEHDVLIYVTEQGLADTRGLDPRSRARLIIEKCAHPDYKQQLLDYLQLAEKRGLAERAGHEPHLLEVAFKMYQNFREKGTMKVDSW